MRFDEVSGYFERLEATSSRLEMYRILGELFSRATRKETAAVAYLCQARLSPSFTGIELGMGERTVATAIARAFNIPRSQIEKQYKKLGDLGLVAEKNCTAKRRTALTVTQAREVLLKIARTEGTGSVERRISLLAGLIKRASPVAARYIARFAVGKLRLGVGSETIIEAIARGFDEHREARAAIERAYNLCSDLGLVLSTLKETGLAGMSRFRVRVGNPVRMMLAERLRTAEAIIDRLGPCAVESKLDGFRCQIHLAKRRVEIYSRNLERTTDMFPDLVAAVLAQVKAKSVVIEGEAMAFNESSGDFYPFQVTVQRKRKHGIDQMVLHLPLALVAFDLLFADGKDYTDRPYSVRRAELEKRIKPGIGVRIVERSFVTSARRLQQFFEKQMRQGFEGVVAKRLDGPYTAGARNFNWIKLKRTYRGALSDTIDAVIVGYLRGKGLRSRLGIGALLAAVYDSKTDSFPSIAKIGSGLSEANWIKMRKLLDKRKVADKPARVDSRIKPDVWVEPKYVVTVLADEITRSPVHTSARDKQGRGLALRFPRVVGFIRDDKSPEDATTVKEIVEMYESQSKRSHPKRASKR